MPPRKNRKKNEKGKGKKKMSKIPRASKGTKPKVKRKSKGNKKFTTRLNTFKSNKRKTMLIKLRGGNVNNILNDISNTIRSEDRMGLVVGSRRYALTSNSIPRLNRLISGGLLEDEEQKGSDDIITTDIQDVDFFTLEKIIRTGINTKRDKKQAGGYFPYYNKTNIDLSDYGIYKTDEEANEKDKQCLILALETYNKYNNNSISEVSLNTVKLMVKNDIISQQRIQEVVDVIKHTITIINEKGKIEYKKGTLGESHEKTIKIARLEGHYFLIRKTNTTKQYLKYYDELKDVKDGNLYIKDKSRNRFKKCKRSVATSINLIRFMLKDKNKFLQEISITNETMKNRHYSKLKKILNLEYLRQNTMLIQNTDELDESIINLEKEVLKYKKVFEKVELKCREEGITIKEVKYKAIQLKYITKKGKRVKHVQKDLMVILTKVIEQLYSKKQYKNAIYTIKRYLQISKSITFKTFEYEKLMRLYKDNEKENIALDFETRMKEETNKNGKIVKARELLCNALDSNNNVYKTFGDNCGYLMLKKLTEKFDNIRILVHNISFDGRFLIKHLTHGLKILPRGRKYLTISGKFDNVPIEIKDTLLLIAAPLSKFGKMFNLEQEKEVMPYKIYNEEQPIIKGEYEIEKAVRVLRGELKDGKMMEEPEIDVLVEQFRNNIVKWKLMLGGGKFNHIKYNDIYCEKDCIVTRDGYNKFKGMIQKISGMNIDNILTSASFSDKFMLERGVYSGCYKMSGVPRRFITDANVGGRTHSLYGKMYHIIKTKDGDEITKTIDENGNIVITGNSIKINDIDAVALYPSGMNRMEGFLKGTPKILKPNELTQEFLDKQTGYFVEIIVKTVGIVRGFATLSYIEDNKRNWKSDMEGRTYVVDKYSLEDAIRFHKITFEIKRGYYYNEGRNPKIKSVIRELFDERIKAKNQPVLDSDGKKTYNEKGEVITWKNPIEQIYKLIMNMSYGKNGLKEITTKTKIVKKEKLTHELLDKWDFLISDDVIEGTDSHIVKTTIDVSTHFNNIHISAEILSMSKRIMNEVMCLAEDNGIDIYYQDTDSTHINDKDIKVLCKLFKEEYGRELMGEDMGQFNSDFNLPGAIQETVHSVELIILGKKSYMDVLVGTDEKGNEVRGYHCRLRGIPETSLKYECRRRKIDELELYRLLFKGEVVVFDLLCGGGKINLTYETDGSITSNTKFTRTADFSGIKKNKKNKKNLKCKIIKNNELQLSNN